MNRARIALALASVMIATAAVTTNASAHEPEPARLGTRLATQSELRTAFPAASYKQLKGVGKVVISLYAKSTYPSWYAEEISIRTGLAGAHTSGTKWDIKGNRLYYEGSERTCIVVEKDESLKSMDKPWTFEAGHKFCGYQMQIRRTTSKPGYYSAEKIPTVKPNKITDYIGGNKGVWSFAPATMMACYEGPYRLFVVPDMGKPFGGWIVYAYGARWLKGNVVGARSLCVGPSLVFFGFRSFHNSKYAQ